MTRCILQLCLSAYSHRIGRKSRKPELFKPDFRRNCEVICSLILFSIWSQPSVEHASATLGADIGTTRLLSANLKTIRRLPMTIRTGL